MICFVFAILNFHAYLVFIESSPPPLGKSQNCFFGLAMLFVHVHFGFISDENARFRSSL